MPQEYLIKTTSRIIEGLTMTHQELYNYTNEIPLKNKTLENILESRMRRLFENKELAKMRASFAYGGSSADAYDTGSDLGRVDYDVESSTASSEDEAAVSEFTIINDETDQSPESPVPTTDYSTIQINTHNEDAPSLNTDVIETAQMIDMKSEVNAALQILTILVIYVIAAWSIAILRHKCLIKKRVSNRAKIEKKLRQKNRKSNQDNGSYEEERRISLGGLQGSQVRSRTGKRKLLISTSKTSTGNNSFSSMSSPPISGNKLHGSSSKGLVEFNRVPRCSVPAFVPHNCRASKSVQFRVSQS